MDIKNVTDFFRKKGVTALQERTAFKFITVENTSVDPNEMDVHIEDLIQQDQAHPATEVDERVFRQAYIPKSLFEVVDPERDTGIVHQGGKDDLIYAKFLDVQGTKSQAAESVAIANGHQKDKTEGPSNESIGDHTTNEQSDSSDDSVEDESTSEDETATRRGKRHEDKDARKVCPK
jgi:RIO kinase 1